MKWIIRSSFVPRSLRRSHQRHKILFFKTVRSYDRIPLFVIKDCLPHVLPSKPFVCQLHFLRHGRSQMWCRTWRMEITRFLITTVRSRYFPYFPKWPRRFLWINLMTFWLNKATSPTTGASKANTTLPTPWICLLPLIFSKQWTRRK